MNLSAQLSWSASVVGTALHEAGRSAPRLFMAERASRSDARANWAASAAVVMAPPLE